MQPIRLLGAWLVLAHALSGTRAASAQEEPGMVSMGGQGDTVRVTLAEARQQALTRNPAFLAELQAIPVAEGELRQAQALLDTNPQLDFQTRGASSAGSGAYEATVSQELEIAGQRSLRVRAARSGTSRARATVEDAARLAIVEVSDAYLRAFAARERLEVAHDLLTLNRQLVSATRIQIAEGEISRLEANLVEIEFGRARSLVLAESRVLRQALGDLERLTGTPGIVPVETPVTSPSLPENLDLDSLIAAAVQNRPDLRASNAALDQASAEASLARRQAFPNIRIGAVAERDGSRGLGASTPPRIGFVVGTTLPLWNRNRGTAAARAAVADEARFRRAAREAAIRTEVDAALDTYRAATIELDVFTRDVIEPARSNQDLLETAFISGKIGLPTMLLLRNQLLDAQLAYWETWLAKERAHVRLEAAAGTLDARVGGQESR